MLGDSVRRRQPKGRGRSDASKTTTRKPKRKPGGWKTFLIALVVALTVPAAIGYVFAVFVLFPPTVESEGGIAVPSLIGQSAPDAQRRLAGVGLGEIVPEQLPHPTAPPNEVVAQSPLPGQELRAGATVRVALSSGPPTALVPDVRGFTAERARSLLERAGFEVTVVQEEDSSPAGRVLRTQPERGSQTRLPSTVTLVVSEGPPETAPDTSGFPGAFGSPTGPPVGPPDTTAAGGRAASDPIPPRR